MSEHMKQTGWQNNFGSAPQTAGLTGDLSSRAASRGGVDANPRLAPANSSAHVLARLLQLMESGLTLGAALKQLPPRSCSRKRLARLFARVPRRRRLKPIGKLHWLLALPEHRLVLKRKPRQSWRTSIAGARRLNRLPPAARLQLLQTYDRLRASGVCGRVAARQVGASVPTLWRWQQRYTVGGLPALTAQHHRAGRKPGRAVPVSAAVLASVRRLNVELGGNLPAWRAYLASPACPAELHAALQGRPAPASLLRATRLTRTKVCCYTGLGLLAFGPVSGATMKFHFANA